MVWLQAGALLSFCAPPVPPLPMVGFFGTTKAACVSCHGLAAPAAGWGSQERVAGLGLGTCGKLGAEVGFALWPRRAASTAEMGVRHGAALQDCSLFTALPACRCRSRVGQSVLRPRVLCFVLNCKYNTIVFV